MRRVLAVLASLLFVGVSLIPQASAATVGTNAWYVLVNRNSGKVLDVHNLSTADGGRITHWARNNQNQQQSPGPPGSRPNRLSRAA
ncbi:RICIN domain-containing protein [Nonomuraea deserti]|uniref:RICIN domain-containing protein n=1 Tax=Nonomuraea deserti TaxID=1848322 RepID=UPI001FEC980C|nr:RICIN domain-containing protein [Nonomuraea deserti]